MIQPRGERIRGDIARQIQDGTYAVGDQLPTLEALARTYEVSAITVTRALKPLRDSGVIAGVRGAGMWVARVPTVEETAAPEPGHQPRTTRQRLDEHEAAIADLRRKVERLERRASQ